MDTGTEWREETARETQSVCVCVSVSLSMMTEQTTSSVMHGLENPPWI